MSERVVGGEPALPVVILSTADIDAPIWTNKQHIATRLAAEREVHYIESLGLRSPSLRLADVTRIVERMKALFVRGPRGKRAHTRVPMEMLKVHTPMVLPFHALSLVRILNRFSVRRRILSRLPQHYLLWSFSPLTYGLEERAERVVYHSVDLLHTIVGIPAKALLDGERNLIARADAVVASSKGVADHLRAQGANPYLWENVADIELFRQARAAMRERRAIFVGNLTASKVEFDLLEAIVARGVRLALAGPASIDGTRREPALDRLLRSPLVEYLGVLSQEKMAIELGRSWVGIIPYHVNDYTAGVFPMKVYEYLGAGLPVVATPLASLGGSSIPGLEVIDRKAFANRVASICSGKHEPPDGDLSRNSWEARLGQIRALLAPGRGVH